MDLGVSQGGLPPDSVVEDRDAIFAAYDDALDEFHDPSPGAMCRIALAPCSPFSVTRELMAETAEFARAARRAAAHAHGRDGRGGGVLPRAVRRAAGRVPRGARLARRRRLARALRAPLRRARSRASARRGTGVAHCPSSNARLGAGIAPVVPLVRAGAPVGLGVDGAASNEAGELGGELRQALLVARLRGGPAAMTAREALELGTLHGARCLGRDDELGTLEVGKLADVVLWRLDDLDHAGHRGPGRGAGARRRARWRDTVIVNGEVVVEHGELQTGDVEQIARELAEVALR